MSAIVDFMKDYTIRFRLDEVARERGIASRREVARLCGIHVNVLNRLANQARGIEFHTLMRICLGLRCSPTDLFEIEPTKKDASPTDDD